MTRVAAVLGALALGLTGCGGDDQDASPSTSTVTVALGADLALGQTYEDPSGQVTLTVRGVRLTGDLLLADAEACISEDGPPGLPIEPLAWVLRLRGREQTIPRTTLDDPPAAARPPWPDTLALTPGECFEGKVAFNLPDAARPVGIVFAQLSRPVVWTIRT